VAQGVREVTFLGQIVDRMEDTPDGPNLAGLLRMAHEIEGVERIRFLTSHPNWMTDELLEVVAELPKVMPHIEVPCKPGTMRCSGTCTVGTLLRITASWLVKSGSD